MGDNPRSLIGQQLYRKQLDGSETGRNPAEARVGAELAGARLDQALASLFPDYSRSRLQAWTREGRVSVNGAQRRPRDKVAVGDLLQLRAVVEDQVACVPQEIPLNIVFEDEHLLVVNKPAGLVVHPAAGNRTAPCRTACCTTTRG